MSAGIGCSSPDGGSRRQSIATVIQTAYDMGGREMHLWQNRQALRRARCTRRIAVGSGERVTRTTKRIHRPKVAAEDSR